MIRVFVDFVDHVQVRGWAQDEAAPEAAISVIVSADGEAVGTALASEFRDDLPKAGIGTGQHAFTFTFPTSLSRDRHHVIHVRAQSGQEIDGSPAVLEGPTTAALGNLDVVDRHHVAGWVRLDVDCDEPVSLVVTVNDQLSGRLVANLYREDLEAGGIGSGRHAFDWYFSEPLSMAHRQVIRIRRELDGVDLPGSPVFLDPPLEFDAATQTALSDLLARYGSDDEVERKIVFLGNELSGLVEKKADLDSNRHVRRRNLRRPFQFEAVAQTKANRLDKQRYCGLRQKSFRMP